MKRKHPHAEMIRRWLDDDSLEVEIKTNTGWLRANNPCWDEDFSYRFKPKMIKCGNMEFPEPVDSNSPGRYYSVHVTIENKKTVVGYHTTKEAAEAHARALISLTEVRE